MLTIQQIAILSLLIGSVHAGPATVSQSQVSSITEGTGLRLTVRQTEAVDPGSSGPTFHVNVDNVGPRCRSLLIDPSFLGRRSSVRPSIVIEPVVTDSSGKQVAVNPEFTVVESAARADDFFALDCDRSFAMFLNLTRGQWKADLKPGTYQIPIRADVRVRTFLRGHPTLLRQVASRLHVTESRVLDMSPDQSLQSDPQPFTISP